MQFLKLVCLLSILQYTRLAAANFSSVFLKVALQLRFVISALSRDPGLFPVYVPCLLEFALPTAFKSIHGELDTEWGEM